MTVRMTALPICANIGTVEQLTIPTVPAIHNHLTNFSRPIVGIDYLLDTITGGCSLRSLAAILHFPENRGGQVHLLETRQRELGQNATLREFQTLREFVLLNQQSHGLKTALRVETVKIFKLTVSPRYKLPRCDFMHKTVWPEFRLPLSNLLVCVCQILSAVRHPSTEHTVDVHRLGLDYLPQCHHLLGHVLEDHATRPT